jgi:O-succinylbenzoate synthase
VEEREGILVKVTDSGGLVGYGECVAFSTPWYTEETVTGCKFVLEKVLVPLLIRQTLNDPREVSERFFQVKGNRMAKAGIEMAVWDLFAKKQGMPLWKLVGGTEKPIPAGVVVAADAEKIAGQVREAAENGYQRIKIKITPATNIEMLKQIIASFPDRLFFADANGGFCEKTFEQLLAFDAVGFALIEQPFGEEEWHLHARAKREMKTPICLDESIRSVEDVRRMIEQGAGDIVVLKMGRLGGWSETLKVVALCQKNGIGMWVGGMIEFGISKAHNLALASLPGIVLPGDFSNSGHFWHEDIIEPEIHVKAGNIKLSAENGIGYSVKV